MEDSNINETRRPFELSIKEIKKICDAYARVCEMNSDIATYDFRSRSSSKDRRMGRSIVVDSLERQILDGIGSLNDDFSTKSSEDLLDVR